MVRSDILRIELQAPVIYPANKMLKCQQSVVDILTFYEQGKFHAQLSMNTVL